MKKTNVIIYNSTLNKGGTESYFISIIESINRDKFNIDVIIKDGNSPDDALIQKLQDLNINIYLAKGSFFKRIIFLRKFFKSHNHYYDVAHINATSTANGLIAYFAKKCAKINNVIFHSHMGGNDNKPSIIDNIGFKLMLKNSDKFCACSKLAARFMFKNKIQTDNVILLNNAVDCEKFTFNQQNRIKIRNELSISENEFVILHVGRFMPQKNQKKLIDIFSELINQNPYSKLVLIGVGELQENCKKQVKLLNLQNNVLFLDSQNNIHEHMSAADCFVMPSLHEGLPVVAVEAQANDLPLILADTISKETKLTENVKFLNLNEPLSIWVKEILISKKEMRVSNKEKLSNLGFDKSTSIKTIENLYLK